MKSSPEQLEREIESIRDRMEPVMAELDHRRDQMAASMDRVRRRLPTALRMALLAFAVLRAVKAVRKERVSRRRRALVAGSNAARLR